MGLMHARLLLCLLTMGLVACTAGDDDDGSGSCPMEDRFTSNPDVACQENFCGLPEVWAATGSSAETFRLLEDGASVPIYFGDQGGYHIDLAARTQNLCPVIFLDFDLYDVTGGGETLIHSVTRHVQAVRENTDPEIPSIQRWWVEQYRFPCAWWPNDDENDPFCSDEPIAFIDQLDLRLDIGAQDHNIDETETPTRTTLASVNITAECCE